MPLAIGYHRQLNIGHERVWYIAMPAFMLLERKGK
nr:MAG TPA_asm: hypothetical protein [Caudoviricetes sp.]